MLRTLQEKRTQLVTEMRTITTHQAVTEAI